MESGLFASQHPLWVGQQLHRASPLYNMAFAFVLDGRIEADAFCQAWSRVVDASDALRSVFHDRGGVPVRQVLPAPGLPTRVLDFSGERDPAARFFQWSRTICHRPLPLDQPLVESVLAKLGDGRYGWYLNQHHLVTDAWATTLLFRQVAAEYAAIADHGGSQPQHLVPYAEATASIAAACGADARTRAEEHWRDRARTAGRQADFYGDPGRPATTRSERWTVMLDARTTARLNALAGDPAFASLTPDISRFSAFAALLSAWLHRVTGQRDVGFDAPAHNRLTAAARRSLGVFIEMFPFAVAVEAGDSFRALGRRCREETQQFLRHALPGATAAARPPSNVVLNYFPGTFGTFAGVPVSSTWLHPGESDSVHALRVQVHDYDATGTLTLHLDLNEDVFSPARRARAVAHLQRLVAAVLDDPDRPLAAIDLLTPEERDAVLVRFNRDGGAPLPVRTVTTRIQEQAARTPDRVALRQESKVVTFGELQARVRTVACALVAAGVGRGDRVALLMPRCIDAVVALLAVLEAQAAYVPIDPAAPPERISRILDDSAATRVLVRDLKTAARVPPTRVSLLLTDLQSTPAPDVALQGPSLGDLAYVMYTSGSTGTPKGVRIEHAGLADYLEWAERQYVRGDQLAFPLFTPLTFDLTVTSLYLPLMTGGTLVIYEEAEGPVDSVLATVVSDNLVDVIKLTPSHLALLRHMDLSGSRIRRVIVGGEEFPTQLARAIADRAASPVEIYNEYGPTEAVVGCMIHRYDREHDTRTGVPIGRPADHVRLYVVTETLAPVPEGVPGELCISRHGLSSGYEGQPELTARAFPPNPFERRGRVYRTGDLVRFSAPGVLEYLGRLDRQLKVSGVRVEPAEVEGAMLSHADVRACVVTSAARSPVRHTRAPAVSCRRCGLASDYPASSIDANGVCSICRAHDEVREQVDAYFKTLPDLRALLDAGRQRATGAYDAMMLLSGGKDSTYALCRLVDMGVRVYAFTFDNGYIAEGAKANMRRVTEALGVPLEVATTPAMPAIFRDSLARFSNVCNGCFKTIYTLATNRAHTLRIPFIVTGLSRGQLFETRLTADMFRDGRRSGGDVDAAVLMARKAYHRQRDEVSRRLDVSVFRDDDIFERITFVDFYRYCDVSLAEMLAYLEERVPWLRPPDTGRSTNCLINDVGIYVHRQVRGFHNYALPYSWDVRLGLKTRDQAMDELNDAIDVARVRRILTEIGYDVPAPSGPAEAGPHGLVAYYVAAREIPADELRRHVSARLPTALVPATFQRIDAVPLTAHGKVDEAALPMVAGEAWLRALEITPPEGPVEERIAMIWREVLRLGTVGVHTGFFELGGTSLAAMEVALRIGNDFDIDLPLQAVFTHPTVSRLAARVEDLIVEEVASLTDAEAAQLTAGEDATT